MKPRLLDLFCGAGGAAMGYARAGFEVVGVDHVPQPRYPFAFIRDDALEYLAVLMERSPDRYWIGDFDAIHASPPCPIHSSLTGWGKSRRVKTADVDLIPPVRELFEATGLPYVIENVKRKALIEPVKVCGQGLGLPVRRHRWFESNVSLMGSPCWHPGPPVIVVRGSIGRRIFDPRRTAIAPTLEEARAIMEMPNGTAEECADALPPAYCELIGHQLMQHVKAVAA
jgi:DNA (cytosine-5)-methyltransferase 1